MKMTRRDARLDVRAFCRYPSDVRGRFRLTGDLLPHSDFSAIPPKVRVFPIVRGNVRGNVADRGRVSSSRVSTRPAVRSGSDPSTRATHATLVFVPRRSVLVLVCARRHRVPRIDRRFALSKASAVAGARVRLAASPDAVAAASSSPRTFADFSADVFVTTFSMAKEKLPEGFNTYRPYMSPATLPPSLSDLPLPSAPPARAARMFHGLDAAARAARSASRAAASRRHHRCTTARDATHAAMMHAKATTKKMNASSDGGVGGEEDGVSGRWYPVASWMRRRSGGGGRVPGVRVSSEGTGRRDGDEGTGAVARARVVAPPRRRSTGKE